MKVKLTEDKLRSLIESVVRESFDDPEMRKAIKAHGGLEPLRDRYEDSIGQLSRGLGEWGTDKDARNMEIRSNRPASYNYGNKFGTGIQGDKYGAVDDNLKGSKYKGYLTRDEYDGIRAGADKLGWKQAVNSRNALKAGTLRTQDGGYITFDPDETGEAYQKRVRRNRDSIGMAPSEKFSGLHLSKYDRRKLKGADDTYKMLKKNSLRGDVPIEKGASSWNRKRSGLTQVGKQKQEESLRRLQAVIESVVRESFDDPEMRKAIKAHGGLAPVRDEYDDSFGHLHKSMFSKNLGASGIESDARNNYIRLNRRSKEYEPNKFENGGADRVKYDDVNLKAAKYNDYLTSGEYYDIMGNNQKLGPRYSTDANHALKNGTLKTNDGGFISFEPDQGSGVRDKRREREKHAIGMSPREKFSGMHLPKDQRSQLKGDDDIFRDNKKAKYSREEPIEKGAADKSWKRSGLTKVGKKK